MEDQWVTWVPGSGKGSPDRLDASVWGGVELVPSLGVKSGSRVRVAKRPDDDALLALARML